jgi:uncharacterized protein (DUF1501 family)
MSGFGRRAGENSNQGCQHGHGGLMRLLGGALVGQTVHGTWPGPAPAALDHGDIAGPDDYRDVLCELLVGRFNVGDVFANLARPRPPDRCDHLTGFAPHDYVPLT